MPSTTSSSIIVEQSGRRPQRKGIETFCFCSSSAPLKRFALEGDPNERGLRRRECYRKSLFPGRHSGRRPQRKGIETDHAGLLISFCFAPSGRRPQRKGIETLSTLILSMAFLLFFASGRRPQRKGIETDLARFQRAVSTHTLEGDPNERGLRLSGDRPEVQVRRETLEGDPNERGLRRRWLREEGHQGRLWKETPTKGD